MVGKTNQAYKEYNMRRWTHEKVKYSYNLFYLKKKKIKKGSVEM